MGKSISGNTNTMDGIVIITGRGKYSKMQLRSMAEIIFLVSLSNIVIRSKIWMNEKYIG